MDEWTERALPVDVTGAGAAVQVAAVAEAGRQADAILGATWEETALAMGVTRQAAHERWAPRVAAVRPRDGG